MPPLPSGSAAGAGLPARPLPQPAGWMDGLLPIMDAYHRDFGRRIRRLRQQRGHSQEELAFRAGIHVTYLSGIERGVRNPSLKNIRAIANALEVPVTALFAFEDDASNIPPPPESA